MMRAKPYKTKGPSKPYARLTAFLSILTELYHWAVKQRIHVSKETKESVFLLCSTESIASITAESRIQSGHPQESAPAVVQRSPRFSGILPAVHGGGEAGAGAGGPYSSQAEAAGPCPIHARLVPAEDSAGGTGPREWPRVKKRGKGALPEPTAELIEKTTCSVIKDLDIQGM